MLKKIFIFVVAALLFTGCGVNIKQEGNKIYTDISKDDAYKFCGAALKTKGYKVTEESKINYYIVAEPKFNDTFKVEKADKTQLDVYVKDSPTKNETIVSLYAIVNGQVDEKASTKIAKAAVAEIINELDMYGKFTITKEGQHIYPAATLKQVNEFIMSYFVKNNIPIGQNQAEQGLLLVKEANATNPFNEPLSAEVRTAADETGKVTIGIKATLAGNYDIKTNEKHAQDFVNNFIAYLDSYPMAEKGLRFSYKFINFETAFANAKAVLLANKFLLTEVDNNNFVLSAQKDKVLMSVTLTELNYNIAVNLEASAESPSLDESKDTLAVLLTNELNTLRDALAQYQTIYTSTKLFTSINSNDALKFTGIALKKLGYTYKLDKEALTISAVNSANPKLGHFILFNNMGAEGISLEINTLYNTKYANAETVVKNENARLLNALASFDKTTLK